MDAGLNTPTSMSEGKLYINFDIEPPAPLELIVFRAQRNKGYYEEKIGK